ncbi:hypothetical protein PHMEG_00025899 [Phytophthora megakarya]|uniref:Reverse transcriptase n=1 Tax=Phytophthora megakarya TaxID=4795 RepID=A0A225VDG4_9STRA|nr:hypothetical protein PHMEG_00025899 [Phytophthora megakarya]
MPKPMSTEDIENAAENPVTTGANSRSVVPDANEELKWLNLKTVLRRNSDKLKYRAARDAWKIAERFLLTDDNVLYYIHLTPRNQQDNQEELRLRLVVPTTMIQEVLQNNHDSLEDVEKHVKSCPDCSSSKSKPQLRGYSPGNILAEKTIPDYLDGLRDPTTEI